MAHRLAHAWSSRIVKGLKLDDDGILDLSSMAANGHLANGTHEHPAGTKKPITGDATTSASGVIHLKLTVTDTGDTYEGDLVFTAQDAQGRDALLIIAGSFHFANHPLREADAAKPTPFDQEDPPWVITKP